MRVSVALFLLATLCAAVPGTAAESTATASPDHCAPTIAAPLPSRASDRFRIVTTIARPKLGVCYERYGWLGLSSIANAYAVSGDGRTLAYSRGDGTIGLYALPRGDLVATLRGHTVPDGQQSFETLAISRDGTMVAAGGYGAQIGNDWSMLGDTVVRLWRRAGGQPVYTSTKFAPGNMVFSPDGSRLAIVSPTNFGHADIDVWSMSLRTHAAATWVVVKNVDAPPGCVPASDNASSFGIGPFGFVNSALRLLDIGPPCNALGGDAPKRARLWSFGVATPRMFSGPSPGYDAASVLSTDGNTLITEDAGVPRFWDVASGRLRLTGTRATCGGKMRDIAAVPGAAIGLCRLDTGYRLIAWSIAAGRMLGTTAMRASTIAAVDLDSRAFTASGDRIYVPVADGIDVWTFASK